MLVALFVRHPIATVLAAGLVVDVIVGSILLGVCDKFNPLPKGVKFGFYKTDEVKG